MDSVKGRASRSPFGYLAKRVALLFLVTSALVAGGAEPARAATFTVNSTGDAGDVSPADGVCDAGAGTCTLRAALEEANALTGADVIQFGIPGGGPHTIVPATPLPIVTETVAIDATSQVGAACGAADFSGRSLQIELHDSDALGLSGGIVFSGAGASGSSVRGLIMSGFSLVGVSAVRIDNNADNVEVSCNNIGTNTAGNGTSTTTANDSGVTVSGALAALISANVIGGNSDAGVVLAAAGTATVYSNRIGVDLTGALALGNGVGLRVESTGNTIGDFGNGNVISGNLGDGILLSGPNARATDIQANIIGLAADGSTGRANGGHGIHSTGTGAGSNNNFIGNNTISWNGGDGILLDGGLGTRIVQNYVGLNTAGTAARFNTGAGIHILNSASNIINGQGTLASGNRLGGGATFGPLLIEGAGSVGNVVESTLIGLTADGSTGIGGRGILIRSGATGNRVGPLSAASGELRNVIASTTRGIEVSAASGNVIRGNYIGTDPSGMTSIPTVSGGIDLQGAGGTVVDANVLAGDGSSWGINSNGVNPGPTITSNLIGETLGGTAAGWLIGIRFQSTNNGTIGGPNTGNTIINNTEDGIAISGSVTGNTVTENSLSDNGELGFDLQDDGVTSTSLPSILSALAGSDPVRVVLTATPSTQYRVELFRSQSCDPSGFGEGAEFLGFSNVTTDGTGLGVLSISPGASLNPGDVLTTTATDAAGTTFEFSRCGFAGGPGIITTVVGTGVVGTGGDGGAALDALINQPVGMAFDTDGSLFFVDRWNHRIRRVDADTGIITTVVGTGVAGFSGDGGPATLAQLDLPEGVAVDADGNLIIADTDNDRIRRVDAATSVITTIAGTGITGFSGDGGPATNAQLNKPGGTIALDSGGNLFFSDFQNHRVRRVDAATGVITTAAGTGTPGFAGDGGPATLAALNGPASVALDASGNLFIADVFNQRVRYVDSSTGTISTIAGTGVAGFSGDSGPAVAAQLNQPFGMAVDGLGNLFVADASNYRVRRIDHATGIITSVAGDGAAAFGGDGGPATVAQVNAPNALAIDSTGNLLVSDFNNHRIRLIYEVAVVSRTFVVTSSGDESDALPGDGVCATSGGPCTLRAAIEESNAAPGPDSIEFNLGGGGNISPSSPLPDITESVTVDGSTEPGYSGVPLVTISGTTAGTAAGITIGASDVTVQGLEIRGFASHGIEILDSDTATIDRNVVSANGGYGIAIAGGSAGNRITTSYIGTDPTGTVRQPNALGGVLVDSSGGNVVGGDVSLGRNLVSGNNGPGVVIRGASASGNRIGNNFIGSDVTGHVRLPNDGPGVWIDSAPDNQIFSPPGGGLGISGNDGDGILITGVTATGNLVHSAGIGVDQTGPSQMSVRNTGSGIHIANAPGNKIGAVTADQNAVTIAGNDGHGILIEGSGAVGTTINGVRIGVSATRQFAIPNGGNGIHVVGAVNTLISEPAVHIIEIGGNAGHGISVTGGAIDTIVRQGEIGATQAGLPLPNGGDGVYVAEASGTELSRVQIHGNGGLGINLVASSEPPATVTLNDAGDLDAGLNSLQNFPILTRAEVGDDEITGTLDSSPNVTYRIDFYQSASCDPSGYGEGSQWVGFTSVSTGAAGSASFIAVATSPLTEGEFVTATATNRSVTNETSEFSQCLPVTAAVPGQLIVEILDDPAGDRSGTGGGLSGYGITAIPSDGGPPIVGSTDASGLATLAPADPTTPYVVTVDSPLPIGIQLTGSRADENDDGSFEQAGLPGSPLPVSVPDGGLTRVLFYLQDTGITLELSADATTIAPGATVVPIANIPTEALLASLPPYLPSLPLSSVDIQGTPLSSVPLSSVPLSSVEVGGVPLSSVPLSSVPLSSVSWEELLRGTALAGVPTQAITINDVLALPDGGGLDLLSTVTLADADLVSTALQNTSLASLALGSIPLSSVPLSSVGGDLCDSISGPLQLSCKAGATLVSLEVAGLPLSSVPLSSVTLDSLMLSGTPLSSVPLSSVPLSSVPLSSVPLSSVPLGSVAVVGSPLSSVTMAELGGCGSPDLAALCAGAGVSDTSTLLDALLTSVGLQSTPLSSVPLSSVPLSSVPLSSVPLSSVPLSSVSVNGIPLSSVPLSAVPLSSVPLSSVPLSSVPLSSVPLSSVPLSSVPLSSVPLSSVPLSSVPLSSVDLIGTPLSSVPLSSVRPEGGPAVDWCSPTGFVATNSNGGLSCATLGIGENSTLLAVALAIQSSGVGLASNPLSSVPLAWLPLSSVNLTAIPLSSVDLERIPLSSVGTSSIAIESLTIGGLPLSSVSAQGLEAFLTCTPTDSVEPCETLGEAIGLGAVKVNATIGDVAAALSARVSAHLDFYFGDTLTLGNVNYLLGESTLGDFAELEAFDTTTVQDILTAMGASGVEFSLGFIFNAETLGDLYGESEATLGGLTFGDLLIAILRPDDYAWEDVPLDEIGIQEYAGSAPTVSYLLNISTSATTGGTGDITIQLPKGFLFQSASSSSGNLPMADVLTFDTTQVVTFTGVSIGAGAQQQITVNAVSGLTIGLRSSSATVGLGGMIARVDGASVSVLDTSEPNNNTVSGAQIAHPDNLYVAHISDAEDVDYYEIPFPEKGSRIAVYLSHLSDDLDLVMYNPVVPLVTGRAARTVSTDTIPIGDSGAGAVVSSELLDTQTLHDIGSDELPIVAISADSGATEQLIETISLADEGTGSYYVRVSGYQGRFTDEAYVLRVKVTPPESVPQCQPRQFPFPSLASSPSGLWRPAGEAGALTSIFLMNQGRMARLYGSADAAAVVTKVQALLQHGSFPGQGGILFVDGAIGYDQFDLNPCDSNAANGVVASINALVDSISGSELEHIVLVGSDEVIPFARTPDLTRLSNEREYASSIADTRSGAWGAFVTGSILTDDPYADFDPIPWLNRYLYVPDIGLGRLVESPDEIMGQVQLFMDAGGQLDADSALVTGYDFLKDGANEVVASIESSTPDTLIDDAWTRDSFLAKVFPAGGSVPELISLNAHFDHYRLLPADQNWVTKPESGRLVTSADLQGISSGEQGNTRIVFSMGCHAGLNVADYLVGSELDPRASDWAQVITRNGAIFVANTGFGYGDTASVALSERLMVLFARRLAGDTSIGRALAFAKQEYFATLGLYGVYDEKVIMQSVFYGLPMYNDPGTTPILNIHQLATTFDARTGLEVASVSVSPALTLTEKPSLGSFYEATGLTTYDDLVSSTTGLPAEGGTQNTHYQPIQPRVSLDVTQREPDMRARGAIVESLIMAADDTGFDPVFHIPVIDNSSNEPERSAAGGVFPAAFQNISSYTAEDGPRQNLVLVPGQYFVNETTSLATQRRFLSLDVTVYYGSSTDVEKPQIGRTDAQVFGDIAEFVVDATDAGGSVERVYVLFLDASNQWKGLDLDRGGAEGRWAGEEIVAEGTTIIDYIVQVVDSSGNVGVSTDKGTYFVATAEAAPQPVGEAFINLKGVPLPDGSYEGSVTAGITGRPGVIFTYRVDGGMAQLYTGPFRLTGQGLHTVKAFGSDGSKAEAKFSIQEVGGQLPLITIVSPASGATFTPGELVHASYSCQDVGDGLAACEGTTSDGAPIDTSGIGVKTFTVTATDEAGRTNVLTVTYGVGSVCDMAPTITGTSGDDVIEGSPGSDVIHGNGGNDIIRGNGGTDFICAGNGNDHITTLEGSDVIDAGRGDNTVNAGGGANAIRARGGDDTIVTGLGDDTIDAGDGSNHVIDAGGSNTVITGKGDDTIVTGAGADVVDAGRGNNIVNAGGGNNSVTTGKDDDQITTLAGDDVILAGDGDNVVDSGGGSDKITSGKGNDSIVTGSGDDVIDAGRGDNWIAAGAGNDTVLTGKDNDVIDAGDGNDSIDAGRGDNQVSGGPGDDQISTGKDYDIVDGGSGIDTCIVEGKYNAPILNCEF